MSSDNTEGMNLEKYLCEVRSVSCDRIRETGNGAFEQELRRWVWRRPKRESEWTREWILRVSQRSMNEKWREKSRGRRVEGRAMNVIGVWQ